MIKGQGGIFMLFSFLLLFGCHASNEGSGSSGGDGVRGVFLDAKELAVNAVTKSDGQTRTRLTTEIISQWVADNQKDLALDIQLSQHIWTDEAQSTCALTERTSRADIRLSIPSCREDIKDKSRAAFLLVHESVHHFGITDEYFADQVARSIIVNLENVGDDQNATNDAGAVVKPNPNRPRDIEFNNRKAESLDPFHVCHYEGLAQEVEADHRPDPRIQYFDGTNWQDYAEGVRVQTVSPSRFKILTNKFRIRTDVLHIEDCPIIDIRVILY